jgi:hypothetical protein
MGLKKYIFGAIVLILGAAGFVYSFQITDYTLEYQGFSIALPIAVWVVVPAIVLFIFSVLHMMFYGMKNYFSTKSVLKDSNLLIGMISKRLLNEEAVGIRLNNTDLNDLAQVIQQLNISVDNDVKLSNAQLDSVAQKVIAIKEGEYIPAKELRLPADNPLSILNTKNRVLSDSNFALEVIKKDSGYDKDLIKLAFKKVLEAKPMATIKKHINDISFDKDMLIELLKKDTNQDAEPLISNDDLIELISDIRLTSIDLIEIAQLYKDIKSPDELIKLFENIVSKDERYTTAYLYVLAEYQVIDKIREILNGSAVTEYLPFRALIDLRDAGKHSYNIETLCLK